MSLTTVNHIVARPGRRAFGPSDLVKVALCTPAFAGDGASLVGVEIRRPDLAGSCTLQLDPNAELTPPGSWYEVTDPDGTMWPIVVPVSAAPVNLRDCVTDVGQVPGYAGVTQAQFSALVLGLARGDDGRFYLSSPGGLTVGADGRPYLAAAAPATYRVAVGDDGRPYPVLIGA